MGNDLSRRLARLEAAKLGSGFVQIIHLASESEADALTVHFGKPEIPRGVRVQFVEVVRFSDEQENAA